MTHQENIFRNSVMEFDQVYFWTDTIKDWKNLLRQDKYKELIISSWKELIRREQIAIYAFVIMPNHLHMVWEMKDLNGKEKPYASFNKFISHQILKDLRKNHPDVLPYFEVQDTERKYRFWQRDPLAVLIDSKIKVEQKIDYIHNNPLQLKWNLADRPEKYYWSSANYYENGKDEFGIITHYKDRF
ncbi:transposase [Dyadobacter sp. 3J3]|uniref:transposase n=1 Tax=Dyadobacter sp. 3J3 TaxID=2606600 RepID=UPI001E5B9926|nr:transposase [Dyadobacter sp. 3J3]